MFEIIFDLLLELGVIICADLDSLSSHQGKMIVNTEHTSGIDKDICNCHNPFYSQRIMQASIILLFIFLEYFLSFYLH